LPSKFSSRRNKRLYVFLLAFALACLFPIVTITGIAVWKTSEAYRQTATARLDDTSKTLARAVEADLDGRFALLQLLAALAIQEDGRENPGSIAASLLGNTAVGGEIRLFDASGDTERTVVSQPVRDLANQALASGKTAISNLVFAEDGNDGRISLAMPFDNGSHERSAIVWSARPQDLVRALQQRGHALNGILVAVTDGNGRILARSRDPERFIGSKAPDWDKLVAIGDDHGAFEAVTKEGGKVMMTFQRLYGTPGWVVVVAEPLAVFNARWRNPLIGLLIGGVIALAATIAATVWIGRLILAPVNALARNSAAIAAGAAPDALPSIPQSSIREFETLRRSVEAAEKTRRESDRRYRTMSRAGALVMWRWQDGALVWIAGWEELTGQPQEDALGTRWLESVHPQDRDSLLLATSTGEAETRQYLDLEFRVRDADGQWRWVRDRGGAVLDEDGAVVEWVGVLEDIDLRKQSEARIAHMARHDSLTGLGNRVMLRERLKQAVRRARRGVSGALLGLDLDLFKQVNDTQGHAAGDALLCAVANRLRACAGPDDLVARVGGDEFAIVQQEGRQPEDAAALAFRIVEAVSAPYRIDGNEVVIGVSVGMALISDPETSLDVYLQRADKALYRAKQNGRGQVCFYEQDVMIEEMIAQFDAGEGSDRGSPLRQAG
jgi:diguanylate cyclase (GGDEF)-like protein/PAS domain S-box-containing protein